MLEVKSLSVRCGALDIVKGVSFAVNDGEWLMIAGPNGAGKSTIINAVTGGVAYTGQILLNGQDIRKKKPVEHRRAHAEPLRWVFVQRGGGCTPWQIRLFAGCACKALR